MDIDATQVTLFPRWFRELGLVKTVRGYRELIKEMRPAAIRLALAARIFCRTFGKSQNQVVLKTAPGHANSVAVALDDEEWPEVVGTLAGERHLYSRDLLRCGTAETVRAKLMHLLDLTLPD